MEKPEFDLLLFSQVINEAILNYRLEKMPATIGLRGLAKQIGISSATLSRLTRGGMPDVPTLINCLHWLEIPLTMLIKTPPIYFNPHLKGNE